ncbi:hypothetical protein J7E73_29320 [Paenibacillus albidus]|uniref:hypothetical protein n=1 Tax=Paenibacillus albidus TaxID=2041023 RepID=UPI001BEBE51F|nr:hypothetical protein [Paenibacillus albidus]MBT2293141.1 hypothetical protein [Paenibacillus albidus]
MAITSIVTGIMWSIAQKLRNQGKGNSIDFAPGVDVTTTGYMPNWDWMTGNAFLSCKEQFNSERHSVRRPRNCG